MGNPQERGGAPGKPGDVERGILPHGGRKVRTILSWSRLSFSHIVSSNHYLPILRSLRTTFYLILYFRKASITQWIALIMPFTYIVIRLP